MIVSAPPRPPSQAPEARDSKPLERDEIEALVEALIEEARREQRRRHRRYWALAALAAFVGAVVVILLDGGAASQTASPAVSVRSGLAAGTAGPRIIVNRSKWSSWHTGCCGPRGLAPGERIPVDEGLFAVNADGSGEQNLTRALRFVGTPVWSPDGRRITFESRHQIYVMNADGSGKRKLTHSAVANHAPAWSPDGRKIAFSRGDDTAVANNWQIYVMNPDGTGQLRLTNRPGGSWWPVWTPDGRIAFTTWGETVPGYGVHLETYLMNADGSGLRNLTRDWGGLDGLPVWSPDGQTIAYVSRRHGFWRPAIYLINADGSGERKLTSIAPFSYSSYPEWSPDGRTIAFEARPSNAPARNAGTETRHAIYVVNADGTGLRRLTQRGRMPLWSPDGRTIAFRSSRDGNPELYLMNADGSGQRRLTNTPKHLETWHDWAPGQTR